jgi:Sulfatase-modifying factor enzyme 1
MPERFLLVFSVIGQVASPVQAQYLKTAASNNGMFKDCADCPRLIVVPAGSFTMGSPKDEPKRVNEHENRLRVSIAKSFAVGVFPVTRGEFAAFASATNHKPDGGCYVRSGNEWKEQPDRSWRSPGFAQDDRHPVTCARVPGLAGMDGRARARCIASDMAVHASRVGSAAGTGFATCSVAELSIRRGRSERWAAHIFAANQVEHSTRCAFGGKHGHHKAKSESCQARPGGNVREPVRHRGRDDVYAR